MLQNFDGEEPAYAAIGEQVGGIQEAFAFVVVAAAAAAAVDPSCGPLQQYMPAKLFIRLSVVDLRGFNNVFNCTKGKNESHCIVVPY